MDLLNYWSDGGKGPETNYSSKLGSVEVTCVRKEVQPVNVLGSKGHRTFTLLTGHPVHPLGSSRRCCHLIPAGVTAVGASVRDGPV